MADSSPMTQILTESNGLADVGYKVGVKKPSSPVHILSHVNEAPVDLERLRHELGTIRRKFLGVYLTSHTDVHSVYEFLVGVKAFSSVVTAQAELPLVRLSLVGAAVAKSLAQLHSLREAHGALSMSTVFVSSAEHYLISSFSMDAKVMVLLFLVLWSMQPVALPPSADIYPTALLRLYKRVYEEDISAATVRDQLDIVIAESVLTGMGELDLWRAALTRQELSSVLAPAPVHCVFGTKSSQLFSGAFSAIPLKPATPAASASLIDLLSASPGVTAEHARVLDAVFGNLGLADYKSSDAHVIKLLKRFVFFLHMFGPLEEWTRNSWIVGHLFANWMFSSSASLHIDATSSRLSLMKSGQTSSTYVITRQAGGAREYSFVNSPKLQAVSGKTIEELLRKASSVLHIEDTVQRLDAYLATATNVP